MGAWGTSISRGSVLVHTDSGLQLPTLQLLPTLAGAMGEPRTEESDEAHRGTISVTWSAVQRTGKVHRQESMNHNLV